MALAVNFRRSLHPHNVIAVHNVLARKSIDVKQYLALKTNFRSFRVWQFYTGFTAIELKFCLTLGLSFLRLTLSFCHFNIALRKGTQKLISFPKEVQTCEWGDYEIPTDIKGKTVGLD